MLLQLRNMDHGGVQTVGSTLDKKLFFTRLIWVRIAAGWDYMTEKTRNVSKEGPATPIGRVK